MTQIAVAIVLAAIILGGFIGLTQRFEVAANGGTVVSAYVIDSFRGTVYIASPRSADAFLMPLQLWPDSTL